MSYFDEIFRAGGIDLPPDKLKELLDQVERQETYSLISVKELDMPVDYELFLPHFNRKKLDHNAQILKDLQQVLPDQNELSQKVLDYLLAVLPSYDPFFQKLEARKGLKRVKNTVVQEFEAQGSPIFGAQARTIEDITQEMFRRRDSGASKMVLSGSHDQTLALYSIAMSGLRSDVAGILVVDRHLDFYHNTDDTLDSLVHKGNFLRHMLTRPNYPNPGAVIVAGVADETYKGMVLGSYGSETNKRSHREFFSRTSPFRSRIKVQPQSSFRNDDGRYSSAQSYQAGIESAVFARDRGLQALYVSIDLDAMNHVTNKGIFTAMEYSPLAFYLSLAIQDIREPASRITQLARLGRTREAQAEYDVFVKTLFGKGHPSEESRRAKLRSVGSTFTESPGLPEGSVVDYLRGAADYCAANNMLFGIPQENGGVIAGDITEAGGLDHEGTTAKRIYRLSQVLHKSSRNMHNGF